MPAKIRIRQTDDLEQIQELDRELFDASLADVLHVSTWWLAEAMVDGSWTPVGYAGAEITNGGAYMFLSRAGVVELARGAGLQRKLIRVRERWARAHGCTHAWTYTHWANTKSQTSLVREGYAPFDYEVSDDVRFLHFRKKLLSSGHGQKRKAAPEVRGTTSDRLEQKVEAAGGASPPEEAFQAASQVSGAQGVGGEYQRLGVPALVSAPYEVRPDATAAR